MTPCRMAEKTAEAADSAVATDDRSMTEDQQKTTTSSLPLRRFALPDRFPYLCLDRGVCSFYQPDSGPLTLSLSALLSLSPSISLISTYPIPPSIA